MYDSSIADWVEAPDLEAAYAETSEILLLDKQVRADDGVVNRYFDIAFRMTNQQFTQSAGTITLSWLPDKGDLTVHRVEIVRDGTVIDVLGQGAEFDVLRREENLERRLLDGKLTASLAVPGLQVGDILRYSATTTLSDQALGENWQVSDGLVAAPTKVGFGRSIISWPSDSSAEWKEIRGDGATEFSSENGFNILTTNFPLPEPEEMPDDAPTEFRMRPQIQVASYGNWRDVSTTMAPHFGTEGSLPESGDLRDAIEEIRQSSADPLVRSASALRLVQDEVSYLLNGLDGGNYLPQSPQETWELKYGDCKAKSILLLAILRDLGIEADATLVRSSTGDVVQALVAAPQAFDHMIVRAEIGGRIYWFDGTSSGARFETIDEIPNFGYALPLREGGADLEPIEHGFQEWADNETEVVFDYSAGLDSPALVDITIRSRGSAGARYRALAVQSDEEARDDSVNELIQNRIGSYVLYDQTVEYDAETAIATISAKGLLGSDWEWDRDRGSLGIGLASTGFNFSPDRARAQWRDLPVRRGGPLTNIRTVTIILPDDAENYRLEGLTETQQTVANMNVTRTMTSDGNTITFVDKAQWMPGLIEVEDLAGERIKAANLASGDPVLHTRDNPLRYWERSAELTAELNEPHEVASAAIIAQGEDDEAWPYSVRAAVRGFYDIESAIEDYTRAIEVEASAELYTARGDQFREIGQYDNAIADWRSAYEADPSLSNAMGFADMLSVGQQFEEALALLDGLNATGDDRASVMRTKAHILGEAGQLEEGWALLDQVNEERPGDGTSLNSQCWYSGIWSYNIEQGRDICDEAVRATEYDPSALDSRAMVHYRLGNSDAALRDIEAAISSAPGMGSSHFLRGIILSERGDEDGAESNLSQALRIFSDYPNYFAKYGLEID
ncbi:MAG: DUF3857 domain-containing protein [Erythrobacter sp.]